MKTRGLPEGAEKARTVRRMFDTIAPRYDLLNRVMTFGMDIGWRRRAVRSLDLPAGSLVLDLACGTGDLCRELERAGYRAAGFDFARQMIARARTAAPLSQADILRLPVADGRADGATCGFALRNVTDLRALFEEAARILRPGGRAVFLETAQPRSRLLRAGHAVYVGRVVPFVGGLLSSRDAYTYLPRSAAYLPDPGRLMGMLGEAGFGGVRRRLLAGGSAQLIVGTRR